MTAPGSPTSRPSLHSSTNPAIYHLPSVHTLLSALEYFCHVNGLEMPIPHSYQPCGRNACTLKSLKSTKKRKLEEMERGNEDHGSLKCFKVADRKFASPSSSPSASLQSSLHSLQHLLSHPCCLPVSLCRMGRERVPETRMTPMPALPCGVAKA